MTFASTLILAVTFFSTGFEARPAEAGHYGTPQDCSDAQSCRQQALAAKERKEYDTFHDLAWRALQKGSRNDAELMLLLARAQSLSGRPHDALVMLQRLAAMGVSTDAATSDDFERVRVLPGWAELEAKIAGKPAPSPIDTARADAPTPAPTATPSTLKPEAPKPDTPPPAATPKPDATPPVTADAPVKPSARAKPGATPKPDLSTKPETSAKPDTAARGKTSAPDPLTFSSSGMSAVGLAYDAVSGRFLIGDRQERRLLVVGERSGRLASLAGSDGGFGDVTAFEIDTQEGDLWVVSASSAGHATTVRKLQLISGRVLTSITLPSQHGAARFGDVAVTPQHILVLDTEGRRLFRVAKKGKTIDLVARLAATVISLAPASESSAYAAYDQGLLHIDLGTRALTVVDPGSEADVSGLAWVRWHRGALVALQRAGTGTEAFKLVRIRLDSASRAVRGVDVLADNLTLAGPTSVTISGNTIYYLSLEPGSSDIVVSKTILKP